MPETATRKKLLVLTHRAPYPPDRGDRIRTYHVLRHLARDFRIYLGATLDEPIDESGRAVLQELTEETALVPLGRRARWLRGAWSLASGRTATEGLFESPELRRRIRRWAAGVEFDAVFAFCSSMAPYAWVPELADVPLMVDLIDVDSQKWLDYAEQVRGIRRQLFALEGRRVRRLERQIADRAAAIALVSDAEADLFRRVCPNDKTHAVRNGVDLDYFRPENGGSRPWGVLPAAERTDLVFVGVLDYRANIDGVAWFVSEVWPLLRRQFPELTLGLVGRNPAPAVTRLASIPGIRVFGSVPDVRPYVAAAKIVIAPLRIARGIQNKVLEAMAMGKAVVASPQALEGLDVQAGTHVAEADQPLDWLLQLQSLLCSLEKRKRLQDSARELVERTYSWEYCLNACGRILRDAGRSRGPRGTLDRGSGRRLKERVASAAS